jgi:hypothetical protein
LARWLWDWLSARLQFFSSNAGTALPPATCSSPRLFTCPFYWGFLLPPNDEKKYTNIQLASDGISLAFCYFTLRACSDTHEHPRAAHCALNNFKNKTNYVHRSPISRLARTPRRTASDL